MLLSLIAAASENNVIGNRGKLPWHLPNDLKHFRDLTRGHTVIMGRKTLESIGRPLPERRNIVITRDTSAAFPGCDVVHSLDEALKMVGDEEVFVIGGGEIYKEAIVVANRIYLTRVHVKIDGDAFFPGIHKNEWKEVSTEFHPADEKNPYPHTFITYQRNA